MGRGLEAEIQREATGKRRMTTTPEEFVNYRLGSTVIDGPAFNDGAKVKLTVLATVEEIDSEDVGVHGHTVERRLIMEDWAGPAADDTDVRDLAAECVRLRLGFAALAMFVRLEMPGDMTLAEIATTGAAAFSEPVVPEQIEALRQLEATGL